MDLSRFVPRYYDYDIETEDLLGNGSKLKNGMIVLIESSWFRADISEALEKDPSLLEHALCANRWSTVTELDITKENVEFVAVYEDGRKKRRGASIGASWLVKKDSIPAASENNTSSDYFAMMRRIRSIVELFGSKQYNRGMQRVDYDNGRELDTAMRQISSRIPMPAEAPCGTTFCTHKGCPNYMEVEYNKPAMPEWIEQQLQDSRKIVEETLTVDVDKSAGGGEHKTYSPYIRYRKNEDVIEEANMKIRELKKLGYFNDPMIGPYANPGVKRNGTLSAQGYVEHESGWWSKGSHWIKGDNATADFPPPVEVFQMATKPSGLLSAEAFLLEVDALKAKGYDGTEIALRFGTTVENYLEFVTNAIEAVKTDSGLEWTYEMPPLSTRPKPPVGPGVADAAVRPSDPNDEIVYVFEKTPVTLVDMLAICEGFEVDATLENLKVLLEGGKGREILESIVNGVFEVKLWQEKTTTKESEIYNGPGSNVWASKNPYVGDIDAVEKAAAIDDPDSSEFCNHGVSVHLCELCD